MATPSQIEKLEKRFRAQIEKLKTNAKPPRKQGGGRKESEDLKLQCFAYIESSKIELLGGKKAIQDFMKKAVDIQCEKLKQSNFKN